MFFNELAFIIWVSGGAELLFDKVKKHDVELPASETKCKFINLEIYKFKFLHILQ